MWGRWGTRCPCRGWWGSRCRTESSSSSWCWKWCPGTVRHNMCRTSRVCKENRDIRRCIMLMSHDTSRTSRVCKGEHDMRGFIMLKSHNTCRTTRFCKGKHGMRRCIIIIIIIIIIKKIGNARPGEGDCHPISPKTPAPHYQPIEEKKRKGK